MALTDDRELIATALSTVDDVTGYVRPPNALNPGDAWPQFGGLGEPSNAPGAGPCVVTWYVLVLLAPDTEAALEAFETLASPLWEALQALGHVSAIEPRTYPSASGPAYNAIQVTMIRELS